MSSIRLPAPVLLIALLAACAEKDGALPEDTGALLDTGSAPRPVDVDGDGYPSDEDCDDWNVGVFPGAPELCDGVDNDCDGLIDDQDDELRGAPLAYRDADGDGYGDASAPVAACEPPTGYVDDHSDCDDADEDTRPGAIELCDELDNDCDASTGEQGTVAFLSDAGEVRDLTDVFAAGTSADIARWSSSEDGTLNLCAGTWYTALSLKHDVAVVGRDAPGDVVIDAGGQDAVVSIATDLRSVSLRSLTLSNGASRQGGGIACKAHAALSLQEVSVARNEAEEGGGLYALDCDVSVEDSEFVDNTATEEGGGLKIKDDSVLMLLDSAVSGNHAPRGGGLLVATTAHADLLGTRVEANVAEDKGGGMTVESSGSATCQGEDGTNNQGFVGNEAAHGGGVWLNSEATFTGLNCDMGNTDGTENAPDDVASSKFSTAELGRDADFTCDTTGCTE